MNALHPCSVETAGQEYPAYSGLSQARPYGFRYTVTILYGPTSRRTEPALTASFSRKYCSRLRFIVSYFTAYKI